VADTEVCGSIRRNGDRFDITLTRVFTHSPGRLWEALTKPDQIANWLAPGRIELRPGGTAKLDFADSGIAIDSVVTDVRPPHVIAYSWSSPGEPLRPLRFETRIVPGGTNLTMTASIPDSEDAPRTAAGFEAHLEMLAAALEDVPIKFPFEVFKAARGVYKQALGV
jgi:uncharacterized protein YndB with AHSA1/START domain